MKILKRETPIGTFFGLSPRKNTFRCVKIGKEYLWIGRVGVSLEKPEDALRGITAIYCFRLDGRPEVLYRLDRELESFDVDEENHVIYGVTTSSEPSVMSFHY